MTPDSLALINVRQILTMAGPARPRRGAELRELGLVETGAILIRDGRILAVGPTATIMPEIAARNSQVIDLRDRPVVLLPGFVDSHTHPAFWGTREDEYELRILGASYEEIAAKGGGILNSARRVQQATLEEITTSVVRFGRLFLAHGTTTIEAKSGYGLSLASELKLLRAIAAAGRLLPLDLVPTFLGAHAYPLEFRQNHRGYLDQIIGQMLPAVAGEGLARYVDVFCDQGFFSVAEAREIITRFIGGLKDWTPLDSFLLDYLPDPKMRATVLASSFAASLEMAREGIVAIRQEKAFAPIYMRAGVKPATPQAGAQQ